MPVNVPNLLTWLRIIAIPLLVVLFYLPDAWVRPHDKNLYACVLFTAADAHMRDYDLWVPGDCVASVDEGRGLHALAIAGESMDAETRPQAELRLSDWLERLDRRQDKTRH